MGSGWGGAAATGRIDSRSQDDSSAGQLAKIAAAGWNRTEVAAAARTGSPSQSGGSAGQWAKKAVSG